MFQSATDAAIEGNFQHNMRDVNPERLRECLGVCGPEGSCTGLCPSASPCPSTAAPLALHRDSVAAAVDASESPAHSAECTVLWLHVWGYLTQNRFSSFTDGFQISVPFMGKCYPMGCSLTWAQCESLDRIP